MEKVIKLLNDNKVCYIATCNNNVPRATPMEYVMVDGSLLFSTRGDTNKDKNLKENNKISLTVNNMPIFVTLNGTTETPSDSEIEKLHKIYFERHPELEEDIKGWTLCYYKVVPTIVYYTDYSQDIISEIIHA